MRECCVEGSRASSGSIITNSDAGNVESGSMRPKLTSVERILSRDRVAHHQCPHLVLLSVPCTSRATSPHDWTVNLCSGETLHFCIHHVLIESALRATAWDGRDLGVHLPPPVTLQISISDQIRKGQFRESSRSEGSGVDGAGRVRERRGTGGRKWSR